ncbi:MAG TPA: Rrf2 family transcriptional regulator [Devosia sp.]
MTQSATADHTFSDPGADPGDGAAGSAPGRAVSLYGSNVEYALHCLLWLAPAREAPASSRDLAELTGVSPALVAKVLPKLEKAGVLEAHGGVAGGYRLAKPAGEITVLEIVDAVDGGKRLFDCKEVRLKCPLFGADPPTWASRGVCTIHAVMLRAEKSMRREMAQTTLLDIANAVGVKAPDSFGAEVGGWLDDRIVAREQARVAGIRDSAQRRLQEG